MKLENKRAFKEGMHTGLPIGLGYFAVSFSLGIMAKQAGISAFQGFLSSATTYASAGEFAGFEVVGAHAGYIAIIIITIVANIRYMLLGSALSQKIHPSMSTAHRMGVAFVLTDEIFGVSIARKGWHNPYFTYGNAVVACPMWAIGTALGVIFGNVLPDRVVMALGVALYGMFIAIVVPKSKEDKAVAIVVLVSALLSGIMAYLPMLSFISSSARIVILTIVVSAIAAIIRPVEEEGEYER